MVFQACVESISLRVRILEDNPLNAQIVVVHKEDIFRRVGVSDVSGGIAKNGVVRNGEIHILTQMDVKSIDLFL